jgi:NAD(P)-dependent dehydrogenase (short-subunit alcohol dehydrogenase family)
MKTLIVTGGTGGLGTTVVARLERDYHCVLLAREAREGVLQADLADEGSVRDAIGRAVEQFGEPYGLVHMAGGFAGGSVAKTSTETWQGMIGLNLTSSFFVIRETLARMRRDGPGRIIAISSEATLTKNGAAAYTVSKSGLNTLIELTAAELAETQITANALLPSTLDTEASRKAMPDAKRVPLDRVAETIVFLLSDAAASISGALIRLR